MSFRLIQSKEAVKENPNSMARFIFGEALSAEGVLVEGEFCIHTQKPAFMCCIEDFDTEDTEVFARFLKQYFSKDDDKNHKLSLDHSLAYFIEDTEDNGTCFVSSLGLRLSSFSFFSEAVDTEVLEPVLHDLIKVYTQLKQDMTDDGYFYEEAQEFFKEENLNVDRAVLAVADSIDQQEAQALCETLKEEAIKACLNLGESSDQLDQAIMQCVETRRPELFTSVQLALNNPEFSSVRTYLLERARALIETPNICVEDHENNNIKNNTTTHTLWAMPMLQTLMHEGDCWFYPQLRVFEALIEEFFGAEHSGLKAWVSPTIFSHHVLNEYTCQPLLYLLKQLQNQRVLLLEPLELMKEKYQKQRTKGDWRLILAWVVFGINRSDLPNIGEEKTALFVEKAEALLQRFIKEQDGLSIRGELVSQVSLAKPMPIWEALEVGARDYNMRRLLLIALSFEEKNLSEQVEIEIKYSPEYCAFLLKFSVPNANITRAMYWIATPDLVPDVQATLDKIRAALQNLGMNNYFVRCGLH